MSDKKGILVVSFGTSHTETRHKTISAIEREISDAFDGYSVKRAFTSKTIIKILKERDDIKIRDVDKAMQRLYEHGYSDVIVQPTHIINGAENDKMMDIVLPYRRRFASLRVGKPLLSDDSDYVDVINALVAEIPEISDKSKAVVLLGHGTAHNANSAYAALSYRLRALGHDNVLVGTVEGYPDLERVKRELALLGKRDVVLMPFLIVAGEHALNDMAGKDNSWRSELSAEGYNVSCILKGLGEYESIRRMFVEHCRAAS